MTANSDNHPEIRWLRVLSVLAFLGLVIIVVLDKGRGDSLPLACLLSGAVLLQLGYEVAVPGLERRAERIRKQDEEPDDGE